LSMHVVSFIKDFFCCCFHLIIYCNSMLLHFPKLCLGSIIFLILVQRFLPACCKCVFPWGPLPLIVNSHYLSQGTFVVTWLLLILLFIYLFYACFLAYQFSSYGITCLIYQYVYVPSVII
jgi:hypothetical protein